MMAGSPVLWGANTEVLLAGPGSRVRMLLLWMLGDNGYQEIDKETNGMRAGANKEVRDRKEGQSQKRGDGGTRGGRLGHCSWQAAG